MEQQVNNLIVILCVLILSTGCTNSEFNEIEDANVFYQIYPGEHQIIRLRRTIDAGAPLLQLFDKHGKHLDEFSIAPMGIFNLTLIRNNNIQITYLIGQSDLEMFLPWYKTNKSNPNHIGKYSISYTYKIQNAYLEKKGSEIDSISIDKKTNKTSLFLNRKLIALDPIYLLIVKDSEFLAYNPQTITYTPYKFANKNLKKVFFDQILSLYHDE